MEENAPDSVEKTLANVREDPYIRRLRMESANARELSALLANMVMDAKFVNTGIDIPKEIRSSLSGLSKAIDTSTTTLVDPETNEPLFSEARVSGEQIATAYEFVRGDLFRGSLIMEPYQQFTENLVNHYPSAPVVESQSRGIRGLVGKLTGHYK